MNDTTLKTRQGAVAVIPARGGSKRLPGKNIFPFFGHPLIAYAIAAARRSGLFERVCVSTDSEEIGGIARKYGAEFVRRPDAISGDKASIVDASLHVLEELAREGFHPEYLAQLMPNCPLRTSGDIVEHYRAFCENHRAFQISAVRYRGVYPQWALGRNAAGEGYFIYGDRNLVNSEELENAVCPTGAVWWTRVEDFLEQKKFYGAPWHLQEIDANRGMDIDRAEEMDLAELLTLGLWKKTGQCPLEPIAAER